MKIKVEVGVGQDRLQSMQSANKLAKFLSQSGDDVLVSYKFNGTEVLVNTAGLVYALLANEPDDIFYTLWTNFMHRHAWEEKNKVETVAVPKELDEAFQVWFKENGSEEVALSGLPVDVVSSLLRKAFHFAYWYAWDEAR